MYHPRFRLITPPLNPTIIIDPHLHDSDIDEDSFPQYHPQPPPLAIQPRPNHSLLTSITLKKRVQPHPSVLLKQEALYLSSEEDQCTPQHSLHSHLSEPESSNSLQFIKKVTSPECIKRKLRRLATVPNKVKLERKDETTIQCSICLSDLKSAEGKKVGKLNCGHLFCFSCILQSSKFATKCPYCRAPYREILKGTRVIKVAEVVPSQDLDDPMDEPCYICGRNDDFERLLECEYCEYAYCHTYCDSRLNSDQPPMSSWYCLSCSELLRNQLQGLASQYDEIYEQSS